MIVTMQQWEEEWMRLHDARGRLKSFASDSEQVLHILSNIQPGDTVPMDFGFGEPVPPR